jgi:hypothetical protein
MKRKVLFFALLVGFAFSVFGQNVSDFQYTQNSSGIMITGYTGSVKDVRIPDRINNLPVVAIRGYAFFEKQLTSITFPNSLIYIGEYAFRKNQLTSITFPNSLIYIGEYAFAENRLTSITFPNSFLHIEENAFRKNQLTSITFPNSLTSIGEYAFFENRLTSVVVPSGSIYRGGVFDNNVITTDERGNRYQ